MKHTLFILSIAFLLSSCVSSTYYYATINKASDDYEAVQDTIGDFVIERDSFTVAYSFNGWDAPLNISVFNKGTRPIFIDWSQSAFIVDSTAYSYAGEDVDFNVAIASNYNQSYMSGIRNGNYSDNMGKILSMISSVTVIPPGNWSRHNPMNLTYPDFDKMKGNEYIPSFLYDKSQDSVFVERIFYNESDSPVRFGSYLTIYTEPDTPHILEDKFYLTNLIKAKSVAPDKFPEKMSRRGDLFFTEHRVDRSGWLVVPLIPFAILGIIYGNPNDNNGGGDYYEEDY